MQATNSTISLSPVNLHIGNVTDLSSSLIIDISEASLLLTKTKDLAEGHKVNATVSSFSHLVDLIYIDVIVEGGMELG